MSAFNHVPVLAREVLDTLSPYSGGQYIDGTLGGGGHSELILQAGAPNCRLLGIDQDEDAITAATKRLSCFGNRFCAVKGNFADMERLAAEQGISFADGILLDIGVSSYQLDEAERGFSYMHDAPLDMRMDRNSGLTAAELINTASELELVRILYDYGEEKWAVRIVKFIIESRRITPIRTTGELVELIYRAVPAKARDKDQHPAKRTFQALRIAVNGELDALRRGLDAAVDLLSPGGRLVVITFHSLEDRIVKERFRYHAANCVCPPKTPVCICGHHAVVKILNRKPLTATEDELAANPRSRSANLRAVIKL